MFFSRASALPAEDVLEYPEGTLAYRIRESRRRRTLGLSLKPDGALHVAAPAGVPLSVIRRFVAERRAWIEEKRALIREYLAHRPPLAEGAALPLLDGQLLLSIVERPGRARCRREEDTLIVTAPDRRAVARAIEAWYRRAAAEHAAERIAHFAKAVGRAPSQLTIRAQKSRWGSCTSRGSVSLNWRLMQMPAAIFDYVVVHELCHLLVPNHSPRFWNEVARVLPDYAARRAALRREGRMLAL